MLGMALLAAAFSRRYRLMIPVAETRREFRRRIPVVQMGRRRQRAFRHPADDGAHYYHHWVAALEALAVERGLAATAELAARRAAWTDAYLTTPHGKPVELSGA